MGGKAYLKSCDAEHVLSLKYFFKSILSISQAIMEEIAGFEDRLNSLKSKGDYLINQCTEHLQAKFKQNIQSHLQGTKDSYSAICSTAQRVSPVSKMFLCHLTLYCFHLN